MWFGRRAIQSVALFAVATVLCGCGASTENVADEEKEPQFLEGRSRVNAMDYDGAIQSFENALIANPRSASAHFELGWLYDQRKNEPATAIYHYGRFLQAHPTGEEADRARTRIVACKQELAKTVTLAPVTQSLQREVDQLTEENRRLREENERWRAYFIRNPGLTNTVGTPPSSAELSHPTAQASTQTARSSGPVRETATAANANSNRVTPASTPSNMKTHTVKSGETPSAIARKYNIRLETLIAANPKLDPRRMHVGQTLYIPIN